MIASRDQWCAEAQSSMPTRQGGSFSKKARDVATLQTPADNHQAVSIHPVNLKNRLGNVNQSSKPFAWVAPPNRVSLKQRLHLWHSRAGGGAVDSITLRQWRRNQIGAPPILPCHLGHASIPGRTG